MTFRPVVITPTYNNAGTLDSVLAAIERLNFPLCIVNDGSTDSTREVLAHWDGPTGPRRATVIHHDLNRGKAAALQTGFRASLDAGFTHAATIDTDGQLSPSDLPPLLALSETNPRALILGVRAATLDNYPPKNRLGRRLSNFAIRLQSGARITDSQCGLRVYPLQLVHGLPVSAPRFGFETEVITRAAWAGCPIIESPITCTYAPPDQRISHFRPIVDGLRALRMHLRLLLGAPRHRARRP